MINNQMSFSLFGWVFPCLQDLTLTLYFSLASLHGESIPKVTNQLGIFTSQVKN